MQLVVDLTMSGIKTIVTCHFEIFFRDVLDQQLNKINSGKSSPNKRIIFMPVVMKGHVIPVIGISPGQGNGRTPKVAVVFLKEGPMRCSSLFNKTV